jgi:RNA polymerase sigma-70 factor (ECF subfamily)
MEVQRLGRSARVINAVSNPRRPFVTPLHSARRFGAGSSGSQDERNSRLVSRAIKSAQQGDSDALGFLYARYADSVYGYVRSIVHDHHEAEDVTQHVFTKLMKVIGKYQEQDVPFLSWILRVARNAALDSMRNNRLVPVEEVRDARRASGEDPAGTQVDGLRDALAALPEAQRQVLMLRHLVGLSPCEIAQLTGKSEGSIHGLHHRGRRTAAAELRLRGLAPATVERRPS